jgi:hypothetical protein
MTRTEEQRPTAGFDLEKARDVEKAMSPMPWIVLEEAHGEMIIIRNPNHPMYIDGIVAWGRVAEANTPDAIGIAYMRENFSNLIGEIERLRAENLELQVAVFGPDGIRAHQACIIADQAARISELEIEIAELKADLEQSERVIEARLDVIDQQAVRIKELEDALVEELARGDYFDESQECEGYWWDRKNTSDCTQNDYRRNARLKLQAKGKIGPDASKSHLRPYEVVAADLAGRLAENRRKSWQITEDRVTAIDQGLRFLEWSNAKTGNVETKKRIAILKTMLEEAGDEHGFER